MHYVYLIYSETFDRFYVGHTHDLEDRLVQHNLGKVRSTKPFLPWKIIYTETFEDLIQARKREVYFKTSGGRRFLKDIKLRSRVPRPND